ncbi:hypothetical protein BU25DRAFT_440025 [Macroventuria anomochaeta]|uniref:Uncharacterized protein n=1 Tax=Macroventuria anomochaeta TaxID=301207 RepID=A0ACB6S088_9PLEO|nr:uncharacterized protein BU25DRAFT_440025 [Macroventuria anomochaeta]KAF2627645.1 hypothetical protein BU25DRAFT_440025 [Macroventuria anomochaeta]
MEPDRLSNEVLSFAISNGAQFIYWLLYLMMIYNITLISQEQDWGKLDMDVNSFSQEYLLQLPMKMLFPTMAYSVLRRWMLGEALQAQEAIWLENADGRYVEHSRYNITYTAHAVWTAAFLSLLMAGVCWWAFTYKREGFVPQMFGSGKQFRHAGLATEQGREIVANVLFAGKDLDAQKEELDERTLEVPTLQKVGRET